MAARVRKNGKNDPTGKVGELAQKRGPGHPPKLCLPKTRSIRIEESDWEWLAAWATANNIEQGPRDRINWSAAVSEAIRTLKLPAP